MCYKNMLAVILIIISFILFDVHEKTSNYHNYQISELILELRRITELQ